MWPFKRPKPKIYTPPPRSPEAPAALAALRKVPGPSPWYLDGTSLSCGRGTLQWRSAGDGSPGAGKSWLIDEEGQAVAVADFHCYVRPLTDCRVLVWYDEEYGEGPSLRRDLRFRVFDTDALRPVPDLATAYARLGPGNRFFATHGQMTNFALSTALDDGIHSVDVPAELREAGELLILTHSTADGRRENHFDEMHLRLWLLDPAQGRLEIVPQDWFNDGAYDFGYQWVTRAARLPESGEIVGEGIRLGVYRLDGSKRNVAEWLIEDILYHPKREGTVS